MVRYNLCICQVSLKSEEVLIFDMECPIKGVSTYLISDTISKCHVRTITHNEHNYVGTLTIVLYKDLSLCHTIRAII